MDVIFLLVMISGVCVCCMPGINLPLGMKPEEFTYFHEMIVHEENALCGTQNLEFLLPTSYTCVCVCVCVDHSMYAFVQGVPLLLMELELD